MALMMTSAVTYVAKISTPSTIASVMGMMGALFFGVGKGSGSLFGGLIMSYIGAQNTFRFFAVNAAICALTYGFFQCLYVRPRKNREAMAANRKEKINHEQSSNNTHINPTATSSTPPKPPPVPKTINKEYRLPTYTDVITHKPPSLAQLPQLPQLPDDMGNTGPRSITGGTRV